MIVVPLKFCNLRRIIKNKGFIIVRVLTKPDREVVEITQSCVRTKSKLTNFMKLIQIEGYNGKYGSNPQGIREILDDLFEFD